MTEQKERLQAFKFELMPNGEQLKAMRQFAGSRRRVWNMALALQEERYRNGEKKLGYNSLCKELTAWRQGEEMPWLKDAPCAIQQQTLKDLDQAYSNFFNKKLRAARPRYKKRGTGDSFRFPDPKSIKLDQVSGRVTLPKLGAVRYRKSREVLGKVRSATVSYSSGKWYISILTKRLVEVEDRDGTEVGIDVGVARFATLSDGSFIKPLNSFERQAKALRRAQRALSRRTKNSRNWRKAKTRVQRLHARVANSRRDFLHKTTAEICDAFANVYVEDLNISGMTKSAKGTVEKPGKNVAAKSGLNRKILDQGWGEFVRQLGYKQEWSGGLFVAVDARNTSRTCPSCGHVAKANRRSQAKFKCVQCGFSANADHVGATNILRRGQAMKGSVLLSGDASASE